MDAFLNRKKRKLEPPTERAVDEWANESTDIKLAMLASMHPDIDQEALLDILLAHDGSVSAASAVLRIPQIVKKPLGGAVGSQKSLRSFTITKEVEGREESTSSSKKRHKLLSKKGTTLHLYDPVDIASHTPCTVVHNFLPADLANDLLRELLEEAKTFEQITFKLFENVVASPHTSGFFVDNLDEVIKQKREYLYNGARLAVRTHVFIH